MERTDDDDPEIPPWLDKGFIARALKYANPHTDESSVEIVSVRLLGGGYLSKTFRVLARSSTKRDGQLEETPLVVKSAPTTDGVLKEMIDTGGVFRKEKTAYAALLPAVEGALSAALGDQWEPAWPKFYSEGSDPINFLVIEDLDASGFRKIANEVELDVHHCSASLRVLARLHAASVGLIMDQQYGDELFRESLIFNLRLLDTYEDFTLDAFEKMVEILDEYPRFRKYTTKLTKNARNLVRGTTELVAKCEVDFKVMLHGDFHRNNIMFRPDGSDIKVRVYDFQGLHVGSPVEDLLYFLHTSAGLDVLRDHADHLVSEYHCTLQDTLKALGMHQQADEYPLEQLRRDMDHFKMISVYFTFNILPYILQSEVVDFSTETSIDDLKEKSDATRQMYYRNERFLRYLEYLVPMFDSKGLLDLPNA